MCHTGECCRTRLGNASDQCKEHLPSGPAEANHLYEATAWSFKARAGGQGMPPAKGALITSFF